MGMSSYIIDLEEKFIDEVSARIGECEDIGELLEKLEQDGCMKLCVHMADVEKLDFLSSLWDSYWGQLLEEQNKRLT